MGIVVRSGLLCASERLQGAGLQRPGSLGPRSAPTRAHSPVPRGVSSGHGRRSGCAWDERDREAPPAPALGPRATAPVGRGGGYPQIPVQGCRSRTGSLRRISAGLALRRLGPGLRPRGGDRGSRHPSFLPPPAAGTLDSGSGPAPPRSLRNPPAHGTTPPCSPQSSPRAPEGKAGVGAGGNLTSTPR